MGQWLARCLLPGLRRLRAGIGLVGVIGCGLRILLVLGLLWAVVCGAFRGADDSNGGLIFLGERLNESLRSIRSELFESRRGQITVLCPLALGAEWRPLGKVLTERIGLVAADACR